MFCFSVSSFKFSSLKGTLGTDFYFVFLQNVGDNYRQGSLNQLDVMVAAQATGWVAIESPGMNIFENRTIGANGVIFNVAHHARLTNSTLTEQKGFHIYSSVQIAVFAYDAKLYQRDGFYVLPSDFLSTEYVAMSYTITGIWNSLIGITATRANTEVNITLKTTGQGSVYFQGSDLSNGKTLTLHLDRLDAYQITSHADLSGTKIESNYPIAVVSGNQCTLSTDSDYCNTSYEQLIPTKLWGKKFLIPTFTNSSLKAYTIRAFGRQNNTFVTVKGKQLTQQDYRTNDAGFVHVPITQTGTVTVIGNAPISVQIVVSVGYRGFSMTIPAVSQFSASYDFQVPTDHNYGGYSAFASVIIKSWNISGILLDGHEISSNPIPRRTVPLGNEMYSDITVPITPGNHKLENTRGEKMGLLVYGYSTKGYQWGYGYVGGLKLL